MPAHRVVGDKATLICQFDMEGDTLYSVKWYKNDHEFYRWVPNDRPKLQVFKTEGIQVDVSIYLALPLKMGNFHKAFSISPAPSSKTNEPNPKCRIQGVH